MARCAFVFRQPGAQVADREFTVAERVRHHTEVVMHRAQVRPARVDEGDRLERDCELVQDAGDDEIIDRVRRVGEHPHHRQPVEIAWQGSKHGRGELTELEACLVAAPVGRER